MAAIGGIADMVRALRNRRDWPEGDIPVEIIETLGSAIWRRAVRMSYEFAVHTPGDHFGKQGSFFKSPLQQCRPKESEERRSEYRAIEIDWKAHPSTI
jgi:hypothetical protein